MKKIKLKNDNDDKVDGWMQTYGDMVTLLMAFFVMLFANSDPHPGKMEEMMDSLKKEFGSTEEQNEFKELKDSLKRNNTAKANVVVKVKKEYISNSTGNGPVNA